jgi:uncharacterized protein with HEPN domain
MKRDYKLYLEDIRESIRLIEEYVGEITEEEFMENQQLYDAVVRRFEIIGEASRNIPKSLKDKNKQVPWHDMTQLRDLISHSYFQMGIKKVWIAFTKELPQIKESMKNIQLV